VEEALPVYREAIELHEKFIKDFPQDADAHTTLGGALHNLGGIEQQRGNLAAARSLLERAVESQQQALVLRPAHEVSRRFFGLHLERLAEISLAQKDHAASAKTLSLLPSLEPTVGRGWCVAAQQLEQCAALAEADNNLTPADRSAQAKEYLRQAWQFFAHAGNCNLTEHDTQIVVAAVLAKCPNRAFRNPKKALELARKAVGQKSDAKYFRILAAAECAAGNGHEAIEAINRARPDKQQPLRVDDTFLLAQAHWRIDQKPLALKFYRSAKDYMDKNPSDDAELDALHADTAALLGIPLSAPGSPK
jgi:tetratricopeptide (TPR) repeat protein